MKLLRDKLISISSGNGEVFNVRRCTIDHSLEDVLAKLKEQQAFLPAGIYESGVRFLNERRDQEILNDIFHLLKKYDLADDEECRRRDSEMGKLFDQS